ncbi:hypothetical protein ABRP17_016645 [Stenotrophomonas sp. WHRI 8082]|uniref:hypothetical protein n=1 Tax=Stenotrophomonas sp. WHRI 8082 TaxID=3162571 RepID=UPI0032EC714C
MSEWPSYATVRFSGLAEGFDPSVDRVEMERGVPKESIINSDVIFQIQATVLFKTPEDSDSFEAWYFNDIKRIGWFSIRHPRKGPLTARIVGGNIGMLSPQAPRFFFSQRTMTLEYLR